MAEYPNFGVASAKLYILPETEDKYQVEVPIPIDRELHPGSVGGYLPISVMGAGVEMVCKILKLEFREGRQYALLQLPWPGSKDKMLTSKPAEPKPTISHSFLAGGDDSTWGRAGTWCAVWMVDDVCGASAEEHVNG